MTFDKGVKKINEFDEKYGTSMKTVPNSTEEISGLYAQLIGFSAVNVNIPESLEYLLDFRIKSLEAERLHIEGWQWGRGSTTDWGFGCRKGSARILNSAEIRNSSAQAGFEAITSLLLFVDNFPEESKSLNLSRKDALFLNAAYYQVEKKAKRDSIIIKNLCADQVKKINNQTG